MWHVYNMLNLDKNLVKIYMILFHKRNLQIVTCFVGSVRMYTTCDKIQSNVVLTKIQIEACRGEGTNYTDSDGTYVTSESVV